MSERRLPGIPPDAPTIPFAVWQARMRNSVGRSETPDPPMPEWSMTREQKLEFGVIQPKAKKARSGK